MWIPAKHVQKPDKLPAFSLITRKHFWYRDIQLILRTQRSTVTTLRLCAFGPFVAKRLGLSEREAADGVFADAAKVEGAVSFDDVGYLGVAVLGAVLKVFNYATARVQSKNE